METKKIGETKKTGRRALLAALPLLAGCGEIGRPWPDLTDAQQAEREAWRAELRIYVGEVLTKAGMRLNQRVSPPSDDPTRKFVVSLVVDRTGYVHLVKVDAPSLARPGLDRFVLEKLTEAGPVPPPPPSLIALNNRLQVTLTMTMTTPAPRAPAST